MTCASRAPSPSSQSGMSSAIVLWIRTGRSPIAARAASTTAGDERPERERRRLDEEAARLDLREVEDVVDHAEQPAAARQDGLRQLLLLRVERRRHQQLRQADHAAHRRADLVAHVGEELALGAGGALGPRGRLGERRGALADARLEAGQRLAQRGVCRLAIGDRLPQVAVALAEARDHRLEIALQLLHLDRRPGRRPAAARRAGRAS